MSFNLTPLSWLYVYPARELKVRLYIYLRQQQKTKYGTYRLYLLEYMQEVFSSHFSSAGKSSSIMFFTGEHSRRRTPEQTPLEKLIGTLTEEYNKHAADTDAQKLGVPTLLWIKFFYVRNKFDSIDMDEYKDFVELASPLDWMGKDELTEID